MENNSHYRILIESGKSHYSKDILTLHFEKDGKDYKINELFDMIFTLQEENKALREALKRNVDSQANVDRLLSQSIDLLSKKIARLEKNSEDK